MTHSDDHQLLREGETCWRLGHADRLAVLIDGDRYFPALAEAVRRAKRTVYVASWDIDSRISLERSVDGADGPDLRRLFHRALADQPALEIRILNWDYAMLYALEREVLPKLKFRWNGHDRLHFCLDSAHPPGASHHQKLIVVDDALAFVGGLDLTRRRWDTSDHGPDDPRRTEHAGRSYLPFHDVQAMVDGEPAALLGELFRERWQHGTGEALAAPEPVEDDPWPPEVAPDVRDTSVGIARTRAAHGDLAEVDEIEKLRLAAIASARRTLYVENPYFTSAAVCEALRERLVDPAGPEVVLVLPDRSDGWLEEHTMNALRVHFLERLLGSDGHNRLAIYYPKVPGVDNINVHGKVLVVDDELLAIGSANLTNRSMRLDSECDVALEARGDQSVAVAIAGVRQRLLAEHLDVDPERVRQAHTEQGSLVEAIETLRGAGRSLVPVEREGTGWVRTAVDHIDIIDPEQPIDPDRFVEQLGSDQVSRWSGRRILALLALLFGFGGLALLWHTTALGEWLDLARLTRWAHLVEETPVAWLLIPLGIALLSGLMFPITPLFFATAAVFDPLPAMLLGMAGCLAAASVNFAVGRLLGRDAVERIAGERVDRLSQRLARNGLVNVALLRLLPVSPFPLVNMVIGASRVRFRDYLIGTAIGMAPGIVLISLLTDLARGLILSASPLRAVILAAVILAVVAVIWLIRRHVKKGRSRGREEEPSSASPTALAERSHG